MVIVSKAITYSIKKIKKLTFVLMKKFHIAIFSKQMGKCLPVLFAILIINGLMNKINVCNAIK